MVSDILLDLGNGTFQSVGSYCAQHYTNTDNGFFWLMVIFGIFIGYMIRLLIDEFI